MKKFMILLAVVFATTAAHAQLIINELSQGPATNKEYVELLVTGTPSCGGANTVDLRGWVIDDNNSWHASGSGTGIAGGHVRFDSIANWANVKIGSLIVIYNDADTSGSIHALTIDSTDANSDYVYVMPVTCSYLQKNVTLPASNGNMTTYGVAGTPYSATGTWTVLGMANSGDAFHTVSPANYTTSYFAVGWGNNSTDVDVYYSVAQGNKVIYMTNAVSNDPFDAANFVDTVATQETPGAPNNAANAAWINGMTNNGQPFVAPNVTFNNPAPLTCGNSSTVITASSTTNGATFIWSNGTVGANNTVTAGGTYRVTVSNASNTCSTVDSVTITQSSGLGLSIAATNTTCGGVNGSAAVTITSGTATGYLWNTGGTSDTIANASAGTYTVTVTGTGGCTATASVTVSASSGNSVAITADKTIFCPGDTAQICAPAGHQSYLWNNGATTNCINATGAGNYYVTVTDNGTCTAASNAIAIAVYQQPPVSISVNGDTLNAYNSVGYQWYFNNDEIIGADEDIYVAEQSGSYTVLVTDTNGCTSLSNAVIVNVTGINDVVVGSEWSVYPNPNAVGAWQLVVGSYLIGEEVELTDATGKLVWKSIISNQKSAIELNVAKGIYLLKISSGKSIATKKLIKL